MVLEPNADSTQCISSKIHHQHIQQQPQHQVAALASTQAQQSFNTTDTIVSSHQIPQHQLFHDGTDTITSTAMMNDTLHQQSLNQMGSIVPIQVMTTTGNGLLNVAHKDYYPSPPSTTETETSSGSVQPILLQQTTPHLIQQSNHRHVHIDHDSDDAQSMEISGHYPEYKH